ncbi:MAG: SDR family oxidoreductase [Alphaproteobacteria bacterium]|nr:SDR family oxidoreductase [Alphaproteobacteria bacterium]
MLESRTPEGSPKTVLVTGASSGYGLATALRFHADGWSVVAAARTRSGRAPSERWREVPLDVTDEASIAAAIESAGPVDVLVNNAGIGGFGPVEATPMAHVRALFETNALGTIAMTRAVIPQLRVRGSGVIVNVTSSATFVPMPLVAPYTASKMAVEGFTASLAHELEELNIRVKLVEPGYGPSTRFTASSASRVVTDAPAAYGPLVARMLEGASRPGLVTTPEEVAEVVVRAATDPSDRLRYAAGPDAVAIAPPGAA